MTKLPEAVRKLSEGLAELPSIGPRQALRLAFYLVSRGPNYVKGLARNLDDLRQVKICERCFFIHQNKDQLCDICKDTTRKQNLIMIVEKETDLISVENTGKFHGRYFILGNIPKTGLLEDWQKLRLKNLQNFITKNLPAGGLRGPSIGSAPQPSSGRVSSPQGEARSEGAAGWGLAEEIILAFNPTSVGDFHASLLINELRPFTKKISRLGRGLPTGGEIEFADDETLGGALKNRA